MDIKQVISFAQRNGYETVEKLNNWNGYECYEPIMDSKKETELGPPLLILVKGDKIRMSTPDEAFQQLDECYPGEDENDGYEAEEEKRTAWEIIRELEKKYKEDDEAMEDIERLKEDIKYLEDMEKDPNYDGTTPLGLALDLEAVLETWN
mgnify:FL=1